MIVVAVVFSGSDMNLGRQVVRVYGTNFPASGETNHEQLACYTEPAPSSVSDICQRPTRKARYA